MYKNSDANHVYYNVRIQNDKKTGENVPCSYRETRIVPIVSNPSKYFFTCVRFSLPTSTIPLLVVPVQPFPNTDTTKTVYSVGLTYGGNSVQKYVMWSPNEKSLSTTIRPTYPLTEAMPSSNAKDSYYYCRSYVHMMNLVNDAFASAFTALQGLGSLPFGAAAPYFTYDSSSKLFSLNVPKTAYDVSNSSYIQIFMNNELYTLFGAFNSVLHKTSSENERQILVRDQGNNTTNDIIKFTQEFSTLPCWNGFKSIVITTGTIPIVAEGIPSAGTSTSNGEPTFLTIVSDYDALFDDTGGASFVNAMQYTSSSEYRLIDLVSTQPLTSFDIECWWMDVKGGLHPLMLAPNEAATLKFLFRTKAFNGV